MNNYSFISNSCSIIPIYKNYLKREYNHPFVGSMFINDLEYLQFCEKFNDYIKLEPIIGVANQLSVYHKQGWEIFTERYVISYLGDIEIHWIHEKEGDIFLEKYNKRLKRLKEPIFIWSSSEFFNEHTKEERDELINKFRKIKNHVYLTNRKNEDGIYIEEFGNKEEKRNKSGILEFNNQDIIASYVYKYMTYCINI